MTPMKKTTLLLPLCIAFTLTGFAQDPAKKPEPAPAPKPAEQVAKPKPAERPKDDAMTAKDAAIIAIDKFIATNATTKSDKWRTTLPLPPKQTFAKDALYEWHMKTNKGEITIHLLAETAPMHVSSTLYLARLGFYDGLKFHRVLKGFMAQGGCPLGNGMGGPGYKYAGEFEGKVSHDKPGLLSMANAGPGTDGSQFFLTFVPTQYLDGKHTVFGEVTAGMDVVKALEACGAAGGAGTPSEPLSIEMSWIVVKPAPVPAPAKPAEEPKKGEGK